MSSKCAAFWHHTNIRSGNRIFPCCRFKTPVATFDGGLNNILNSKKYEELRDSDVSTLWECQKCMHEESLGKESLRNKFNKEYDTDTISLEYLEIGFDNICNAACDGCYPEFSSEWSKILNPNASKGSHIISSEEIISIPDTVRKILFLGGEPLMTNRHKKLLRMVKDLSLLKIVYNTNGTFLLDDETINLLNQCKEVEFILSIDGYGSLNETVRKNCEWKKIEMFIQQIKNTNYKLSINTVIHKNNYHGINELQEYVDQLNVEWSVNILTYPSDLDIANIEDKTKLLEVITNSRIPNKEAILKHANDN